MRTSGSWLGARSTYNMRMAARWNSRRLRWSQSIRGTTGGWWETSPRWWWSLISRERLRAGSECLGHTGTGDGLAVFLRLRFRAAAGEGDGHVGDVGLLIDLDIRFGFAQIFE